MLKLMYDEKLVWWEKDTYKISKYVSTISTKGKKTETLQ